MTERIGTDASDYFLYQNKRLALETRRPLIRRPADLVGPGIAPNAVRLTNFNDLLATFDGYFSAVPGALNAPNGTDVFVGTVTSDAALGGWQNFRSLDTETTYERQFTRHPLDPEAIAWGAWQRAGEMKYGAIDVRRYGVISSNSTDQTTAIEDVDALAVSSGRPLYFPAGTYRFSNTLLARTIMGDGKAVTTLRYLGTGNAIGVASATTRTYHRRVQGVTIQGGGSGVGIDIASASSGVYRDLILLDLTTGAHLRSPGTASWSLYNMFDNVACQGVTSGWILDEQSNDNRFLSCRVNVADNYGIRINSGNHNTIRDCAFEGVGNNSDGSGAGDWAVYVGYTGTLGHTQNNVIDGNRFEMNEGNLYILANVNKTRLTGNRFYATLNSNANGYYTDSGVGTLDYYNVTG